MIFGVLRFLVGEVFKIKVQLFKIEATILKIKHNFSILLFKVEVGDSFLDQAIFYYFHFRRGLFPLLGSFFQYL